MQRCTPALRRVSGSDEIFLGLLLSFCALLAGCSAEEEPQPRDILLITVDTLRADHLQIYGYPRETAPALERWFEGGAVFERAYSTEASTSPSVASILTGQLPQEHGVRLFFQLLPEGTELISDLLPEAYETAAVVSNMVLTDEAMGLAAHFEHFDDHVDQKESERDMFERNGRGTTEAALRWLSVDRDPERPLFLWVHYIDPHGPYQPPADWEVSFTHEGEQPVPESRIPRYGRLEGVTDGLTYVDRYDAEITFVDSEIDRLLKGYARFNDIDQALILMTSDHGESMMEHERWFAHTYHVYEEIARVPLLLRGPGVEPGRRTGLVSGIDVAPTLLRFAGVEPPPQWNGVDLRSGETALPGRVIFVEASQKDRQWRSALRGNDKWLVGVVGEERELARRAYYDLAQDPNELSPARWTDSAPAPRFLLDLIREDPDPAGIPSQFRQGIRLDAPKVAPNLSEKHLEALRKLGYAE
jgi:arylsulfatase A-like enzyme